MMQIYLFLVFKLFIISNLSASFLHVPVAAKHAILINAETGKILFGKQAEMKTPPASTTKIATALLVLQKATSLDEVVKSPLDCLIKIPKKLKIENRYQDPPYRLEPDGTSYGIFAGEKLTIRDLLHGMMLCSGNDASNVLASHFSNGKIEDFMEEMNLYLKKIGCQHTKFYNPHGLHFPTHVTTAKDLAILAKEAIKNKEFLSIVGSVSYERPRTNKQGPKLIWTTNRLLKKGPLFYSKAFGIKSGYHENAGYNFVGAAKDQGRTLISVVLQCPTAVDAYKDTIKMFESAFMEKKLTRVLLNAEETLFSTQVKGTKKILKARILEDVIYEYYPSEEETLLPEVEWSHLTLPIKKEGLVGNLYVKNSQGQILTKKEIYSMVTIKESLMKRLMKGVRFYHILMALMLVIIPLATLLIWEVIRHKDAEDLKKEETTVL